MLFVLSVVHDGKQVRTYMQLRTIAFSTTEYLKNMGIYTNVHFYATYMVFLVNIEVCRVGIDLYRWIMD